MFRKSVPWIAGGMWGVLGGYRSLQENTFKINERRETLMKRLEDAKARNDGYGSYTFIINDCENELVKYDNPSLYIDNVGHFTLGMLIYLNPFFAMTTVSKELYRIEVNMRGLESEKTTRRYKEIF